MKKLLIAFMLILTTITLFSCGKENPVSTNTEDDAAINSLLLVSGYTDTTAFVNDGTTVPYASDSYTKTDTFPEFVKFARKITTVTRTVSIVYNETNTEAVATITIDLEGVFYVDNDGDADIDPYTKPINDQGLRKVWLVKINDNWRISGVSPLEIVSPDQAVIIDSVQVLGCINGPITILPADMTTKRLRENLPIFAPGATATAMVWTRHTSETDSTWPFLHRWIYQPTYRKHIREPFYKEAGYFTRSWDIVSDSIVVFPAIRHASVDAISGSCLFGDSTTAYSARIWCLPYIVTTSTDVIP